MGSGGAAQVVNDVAKLGHFRRYVVMPRVGRDFQRSSFYPPRAGCSRRSAGLSAFAWLEAPQLRHYSGFAFDKDSLGFGLAGEEKILSTALAAADQARMSFGFRSIRDGRQKLAFTEENPFAHRTSNQTDAPVDPNPRYYGDVARKPQPRATFEAL